MSRIFGLDNTSPKLQVKFKHEIIMSLESVKLSSILIYLQWNP